MSKITGNESAFGFVDNRSSSYEDNEVHYGLSKREYFAAMAMQGYCANESVAKEGITISEKARASVMMADQLINELNKE